MPQLNELRAVTLTASLALSLLGACSNQTEQNAREGKLYAYREQIAEGLVSKPVTLSSPADNSLYQAFQAPAAQCGEFWQTGDPDRARTTPALCDEQARQLRRVLETRFGEKFTVEDVQDPRLWAFLMPRIEGQG
jgi:hypothetical protein